MMRVYNYHPIAQDEVTEFSQAPLHIRAIGTAVVGLMLALVLVL